MKTLQLNTKKLYRLMKHNKLKQSDLAKAVGISRQAVNQHIAQKTSRGAELFAPVFKMHPKDLIE